MADEERGEPSKTDMERKRMRPDTTRGPTPPIAEGSGAGRSEGADKIARGRGGFRSAELKTIPSNIKVVHGSMGQDDKEIFVLTNFISVSPMKERQIYQYRIDFSPDIESEKLRRQYFRKLAGERFGIGRFTFDGMYDLVSGVRLSDATTTFSGPDPRNETNQIHLTIKRVGNVSTAFELIRTYNLNMKDFLRTLGFFNVGQRGSYVHTSLATQIGRDTGTAFVRGYRTSANVHENNQTLMNLESVHKVMQQKNVLEQITELRNSSTGDFKEAIRSKITGKIVVTSYKRDVYRIEDIDFDRSPSSTFRTKDNSRDISYLDYFQSLYNVRIVDRNQPLLLVVPNNTRRRGDEEHDRRDIYLVPELCNIAGLTDDQRSNSSLGNEMKRVSQIPPADHVAQLRTFLQQFHANDNINRTLAEYGYEYAKEPVRIKARTLETERVGVGVQRSLSDWPKVDVSTASFDRHIVSSKVAVKPAFKSLVVLITRQDLRNRRTILDRIRHGFETVGLVPLPTVDVQEMNEGDSAQHFVQYLRNISSDVSATLIILPRQNKMHYDTIKKLATVDRGMITQVVTSKLLTVEEKKAKSVAVKVGIQMAAKLGGEPWYVQIPLPTSMICGYDTYHDTSNRGRSYGAFLASMNPKYSKWFSRVDSHDHLDELSSHLVENMGHAMRKYKDINGKFPEKVFIYRDGVSDGQLSHVYDVELKQIDKSIKSINEETLLTFIVVNKRIGARFYMCNNNTFINPPPGSVIDDVVTRKERYDFYLISQSTRNGTVTPTYYNILFDESGLDANKQQRLAFKLCFLYYNWTGTVRVPAPCQYAHKLALLCGEHLHSVPNSSLENNLHFL